MKLIIGNKNYSSWSLRSWWLMRQHQLPFEEVRIPLFTEFSKDRIQQYSETGKVPVLLDGNLRIWDSLAICEYLNEQYLDGRGWPRDAHDRAIARSCAAEMHSGFTALRSLMPMNCRARQRRVATTPELAADIQRVCQLFTNLRSQHQHLGPWLMGRFSILDCMYAPVVLRFLTYQVDVSALVGAYMEEVLADPHLQAWLADAEQETEVISEAEVGMTP